MRNQHTNPRAGNTHSRHIHNDVEGAGGHSGVNDHTHNAQTGSDSDTTSRHLVTVELSGHGGGLTGQGHGTQGAAGGVQARI